MGCSFVAPIQSALGSVAKAAGSIPGANIILPVVAGAYLGPVAGRLLGATAGTATAAAITGAVGGATAGALSGGGLEGVLGGAALGGAGGYALSSLMSPATGATGGTAGDLAANIQAANPNITAAQAMQAAEAYLAPGSGFSFPQINSALIQDMKAGGANISASAADKFVQAGYTPKEIQAMIAQGTTAEQFNAIASNFDAGGLNSALKNAFTQGSSGIGSLGNTLGSLASGAASLYGAKLSSDSAGQAALLQKQSTDAALDETKRQFNLGQAAQMPWRAAGQSALGEQVDLMGLGANGAEGQLASLMKSPGYEFRLGEGQKALERSAAARGGLFGGATGKALTRYGQDYGSNEYGNRLAQLSSLSGQGQAAASGMAGLGTQYAGNVSNLLTNQGNAGAAASIAQGSAKQSGILGAGSALSNLFNPPKQNSLADLLRGYA